jgi:hypothetical protein
MVYTRNVAATEPARFEQTISIAYPVATAVSSECLAGYKAQIVKHFDTLDATLSQRCSSSVQVFVRFLDVHMFANSNNVTANFTVQILPSVLQTVFYQLCSLTISTIFNLGSCTRAHTLSICVGIPSASTPIVPLLSMQGDAIATQGLGCPSLTAAKTLVTEGFGCADGEVLRDGGKELPECCMFLLSQC